jgi:Mn2+/Fe2+ NRAMP family transporter
MMFLGSNSKVMGKFTLPLYLRVTGWLATCVMLLASVGMLANLLLG